MRNCNASGTVKKWQCDVCGNRAVKVRTRWVIKHHARCTVQGTPEDVGPVTSVNDPDNAYFVADD